MMQSSGSDRKKRDTEAERQRDTETQTERLPTRTQLLQSCPDRSMQNDAILPMSSPEVCFAADASINSSSPPTLPAGTAVAGKLKKSFISIASVSARCMVWMRALTSQLMALAVLVVVVKNCAAAAGAPVAPT